MFEQWPFVRQHGLYLYLQPGVSTSFLHWPPALRSGTDELKERYRRAQRAVPTSSKERYQRAQRSGTDELTERYRRAHGAVPTSSGAVPTSSRSGTDDTTLHTLHYIPTLQEMLQFRQNRTITPPECGDGKTFFRILYQHV
jgi:hypothetical protein